MVLKNIQHIQQTNNALSTPKVYFSSSYCCYFVLDCLVPSCFQLLGFLRLRVFSFCCTLILWVCIFLGVHFGGHFLLCLLLFPIKNGPYTLGIYIYIYIYIIFLVFLFSLSWASLSRPSSRSCFLHMSCNRTSVNHHSGMLGSTCQHFRTKPQDIILWPLDFLRKRSRFFYVKTCLRKKLKDGRNAGPVCQALVRYPTCCGSRFPSFPTSGQVKWQGT